MLANNDGVFSTPKAHIALSVELRKVINERNMLTTRTRKKVLSALDDITCENDVEKQDLLRTQAIREIYTSEISYLHQLELIMKYFMIPIKTSKYLSESNYNTIFGNIETIYNVNGELLKELKTNLDNVAAAFLKLAPYFKLYSFYAYDYKSSVSILQNTQNNNPEFKQFIEHQEIETEWKLPSLLITPIQRIPRYRLLLKQVLEYSSPTNSDYQMLIGSLKQVERTADHINGLVEEHENIERMLELQRSLQNNYPCIIKPGRRLLKEGFLMKLSEKKNRRYQRYFVLMSDILMYCKVLSNNPKAPNSMQCCCILPLNKCKVDIMLNKMSFKLTCQNECFLLYSDTENDTEAWIKTLIQSITQYVQCRKTLRKDSSCRQPVRRKYDIEFDYLGLSPSILKQRNKVQDFDNVFHVNSDESTHKIRKYFPMLLKKRSSSENNDLEESPSKKMKMDKENNPSTLLSRKLFSPNNTTSDNKIEAKTSKFYGMFSRIKSSIQNLFTFK